MINTYAKIFTLLMLFFLGNQLKAQPYEIGHQSTTFIDNARNDRGISVEIYYPATSEGEEVPLIEDQFPMIVFGHGFVMSVDAYQNIWEEMVSKGYIVVLPKTEDSFFPSHNDFGLDLAFCINQLVELNGEEQSIFYEHLNEKAFIAGHSMGGGAAVLGASNSPNVIGYIGLAPAETSPSAIAAAANIDVPVLIFSGVGDAVTPPSQHHEPIYNSFASECKLFISVLGGGHCYFADENFNCDFGELTVGSNISITRTEQQAIMNEYWLSWMEAIASGLTSLPSDFEVAIGGDERINYSSNCLESTGVVDSDFSNKIRLFPNPTSEMLFLEIVDYDFDMVYQITDVKGIILQNGTINSNSTTLSIHHFPKGVYYIKIGKRGQEWSKSFVKY